MSLHKRKKTEDTFIEKMKEGEQAPEVKPKKKRSEASKKLLHDEVVRLRKEERDQIDRMLVMLTEQGKMIRSMMDKEKPAPEPEPKPEV